MTCNTSDVEGYSSGKMLVIVFLHFFFIITTKSQVQSNSFSMPSSSDCQRNLQIFIKTTIFQYLFINLCSFLNTLFISGYIRQPFTDHGLNSLDYWWSMVKLLMNILHWININMLLYCYIIKFHSWSVNGFLIYLVI